jgi:hypothetical protein
MFHLPHILTSHQVQFQRQLQLKAKLVITCKFYNVIFMMKSSVQQLCTVRVCYLYNVHFITNR